MSLDVASLVLKIDSTSADNAAVSLDNMAESARDAETQARGLSNAAKTLNATHLQVNAVAGGVTNTLRGTGAAARLTANEALNLSRQFADVGVTAAMGMNPFMILLQQGPQIADIMKTSGLGIRGVFQELGLMLGVLERVSAANDNGAVTAAAQSVANTSLAASANAAAVAEERLAVASGMAARGAATAAAGATTATAANTAMASSATAAGAATTVALAPLGAALGVISIAAIGIGAAFMIGFKAVKESVGDVTKGMGLTEKQLDRLKEKGVSTAVTMGDTFKAFFQVIGSRLANAFAPQIDFVQKKFSDMYVAVSNLTYLTFKTIVSDVFAAFSAIKATFSNLPAIFANIGALTANAFLTAIEYMVNKSIDGLNKLASFANKAMSALGFKGKIGTLTPQGYGRMADNGALSKVGAAAAAGFGEGGRAADRFLGDVTGQAKANAQDRVRAGAGDAGAAGAASKGAGDKKSAVESQIKSSEEFVKALQNETAEIGLNQMQLKRLTAEREIAKAPTDALKNAIRAAQAEFEKATTADAVKDLRRELKLQNDELTFENSLLTMNIKEREVAIARREIEAKVAALAAEGIEISAASIQAETDAILAQAAARGQDKLDTQNLKAYTDSVHDMNDAIRESVSGFGELFGTAGEGFENLINVITDYSDRRAELEERIADMTDRTAQGDRDRQAASDELARAHVANVGNMLGASKTFFKEGTTGYKVLSAAEKAYRIYQAVSTLLHIGNTAKAIAADTAHTASSVANSGLRATADGVAGIAKAIASLPFPLNILAGAATLAALVAVGVKISGKGGGGGGGGSGDTTSKQTGPGDSTAMSSPYSTLPGAGGLYDPKNAGQNGTAPLASANDNRATTFVYSPTISAPGADAGVVQQINDMLVANRNETIELARQASAGDRAEAAARGRI